MLVSLVLWLLIVVLGYPCVMPVFVVVIVFLVLRALFSRVDSRVGCYGLCRNEGMQGSYTLTRRALAGTCGKDPPFSLEDIDGKFAERGAAEDGM